MLSCLPELRPYVLGVSASYTQRTALQLSRRLGAKLGVLRALAKILGTLSENRCTLVMLLAYEGFCEDLARQTTVTHLSQLQLGFRRCRIWVSVIVVVSYGHYLGCCTVCLSTSAHWPCFDLSV